MRTVDALLSEYGESHKNPTNKAVHWICVPIIFWTVVALLWSVKIPYIIPKLNIALNGAMIGLALALVYYITLSPLLALGMLLFSILCMAISYYVEIALRPFGFPLWAVALVVFVLAWIGQFWGHSIEGKKPSFLKDLQFLLIGPAWLMHFIFKKAGIAY
jgi:uncharacterized membrane protein YGL010W